MFCGTLAESSDVIYIPDIEEPVLRILVRYLYEGEVNLTAEIVMPVMYAANKYDVSSLENTCKLFLEESIDPDNVCIILDHAIRFDYHNLKQLCLDFIKQETKSVLESHAFVGISVEGLKEVLEMNTLLSCEYEVYLACRRWASKRIEITGKQETGEEIRSELGDEIINLIRFPCMTLEEITDVVYNNNVLTKEEMVAVYKTIATKINVSRFRNEAREMTKKRYLFVRTVEVGVSDTEYAFIDRQDGITFTVSNECALTGIDMFLPWSEVSTEGVLDILEGNRIVHLQNIELCCRARLTHKLVQLDTPVHLHGHQEYSIRQKVHGASRFLLH